MYIAMNRFKVALASQAQFETQWLSRESYLDQMAGFIEFHLLKGPDRGDHRLYSSYTLWATKADFEAWTQSEAFKRSHARAGVSQVSTLGHPEFEGFDVLQSLGRLPAADAAE